MEKGSLKTLCVLALYSYCFVLFEITVTVDASNTNFRVQRFELCNKTQGLLKFNGNITTEMNEQYITADMTHPFALDDNIGVICRIESKIGNVFVELFVIREKNYCKAVHKYMGEFWYSIERAVQIPPGQCPIAAGRYRLHHVKLDYRRISLQTFPFGRLRFTIKLVDNKNPAAHLACLVVEADNASS